MDASRTDEGLAEGLPGLLGQSQGPISEAVASEGPARDPSSEAFASEGLDRDPSSEAVASKGLDRDPSSEAGVQPCQDQEDQAGLHPWLDNRGLDTSRVDQVQPPGIYPVVLSAPQISEILVLDIIGREFV